MPQHVSTGTRGCDCRVELLELVAARATGAFDAKAWRNDCFRRDIAANIAENPRVRKSAEAEGTYANTELCRDRTAVERTNSWLDRFKTWLVRVETSVEKWPAFLFPAFVVLLLLKTPPKLKS